MVPAQHGADAGRDGRTVGVRRPEAGDRHKRRAAEGELRLGPAAQIAPRVRARPRRGRSIGERGQVARERAVAGGGQTAVRLPQPLQSDDEVTAVPAALELRRRMPLAEPHRHAMRQAQFEREPARAVGADRADGPLHRHAARFVEGGEGHVGSVAGRVSHVGHELSRTCANRAIGARRNDPPGCRGQGAAPEIAREAQLTFARTANWQRPARSAERPIGTPSNRQLGGQRPCLANPNWHALELSIGSAGHPYHRPPGSTNRSAPTGVLCTEPMRSDDVIDVLDRLDVRRRDAEALRSRIQHP